ncbi:ABC transporter substrate-binding protein [Plastoroseomonas arctica]|uniref:ABC transporter substrate-binding protein n=1 Tax=Plastoroseomonas arctica TaxID=1509237 RepID=A0AAF1K4U6_9PROT|nr:ABC transporter substrate-binding protein [Plastoroseomonas arctica]MBR0655640.1 ABC transporter substrate-binding protein [Plastoroseomonas arctica]
MMDRRTLLATGAAALLPRFAIAQADQRPSITIAVQRISNSNTLETLREQSNVGSRTWNSYGETLIETDWLGDLSPMPGLATEWRRIDDRTVELKLRQGVRFHDGTPMTAEDVAFSFGPERMGWAAAGAQPRGLFVATPGEAGRTPPPEVPAVARRTYPGFERIEIVDAQTVRYVNRTPDPTIEGRITRNTGMILSRAAFAGASSWLDHSRRPIGTGPYRVVEFRPDQSLTLEAFDDYWGGRPPVRRIRFMEVPEVSSRINALLSGEADFACDMPPDQIATIARSPRHEVVGDAIMNHRLTVFDTTHPVLANPLIRRAITHAIDRAAIVAALWDGRAPIPRGLQFEHYGPMFHADWEAPRFDIAETRRLLREANYRGEPIPYRLLNNYYANQTATAQILIEGWRAAGLNIRIEMRENFTQIFDRTTQRGIRDWSNSASYGDPVSSLVAGFGPEGQAWQVGEWRNAEFGTLSGVLESSMDMAERRAAFRRMLQIAEREDPVYTVLHQSVNLMAKRRDIAWRAGKSFFMDFRARNWGG